MRVLLACVFGCLALAAAAAASQPPGRTEAHAIGRFVAIWEQMPGSPVPKHARVVSIRVSTVDPRYAAVDLTSTSGGELVMVLHQSHGIWWLQQAGRLLGCDTAPRAVLDDLDVACKPPDGVAWISNCSQLESKPASLVISCADDNYLLVGLRWRTWGSAAATASGTARVNDCTPDCAGGRFHDYPVTVTASTLTRCGVTPVYARLTIAYAGSRPAFLARNDRHELLC